MKTAFVAVVHFYCKFWEFLWEFLGMRRVGDLQMLMRNYMREDIWMFLHTYYSFISMRNIALQPSVGVAKSRKSALDQIRE